MADEGDMNEDAVQDAGVLSDADVLAHMEEYGFTYPAMLSSTTKTIPDTIDTFDDVDRQIKDFFTKSAVSGQLQNGEVVDYLEDGHVHTMTLKVTMVIDGYIANFGSGVCSEVIPCEHEDAELQSHSCTAITCWNGQFGSSKPYQKKWFAERTLRRHVPNGDVKLPLFPHSARGSRYSVIGNAMYIKPVATVVLLDESEHSIVLNDLPLSSLRDVDGNSFSYMKVLHIGSKAEYDKIKAAQSKSPEKPPPKETHQTKRKLKFGGKKTASKTSDNNSATDQLPQEPDTEGNALTALLHVMDTTTTDYTTAAVRPSVTNTFVSPSKESTLARTSQWVATPQADKAAEGVAPPMCTIGCCDWLRLNRDRLEKCGFEKPPEHIPGEFIDWSPAVSVVAPVRREETAPFDFDSHNDQSDYTASTDVPHDETPKQMLPPKRPKLSVSAPTQRAKPPTDETPTDVRKKRLLEQRNSPEKAERVWAARQKAVPRLNDGAAKSLQVSTSKAIKSSEAAGEPEWRHSKLPIRVRFNPKYVHVTPEIRAAAKSNRTHVQAGMSCAEVKEAGVVYMEKFVAAVFGIPVHTKAYVLEGKATISSSNDNCMEDFCEAQPAPMNVALLNFYQEYRLEKLFDQATLIDAMKGIVWKFSSRLRTAESSLRKNARSEKK